MLYHAETGEFFGNPQEAQAKLKCLAPVLQEVTAKPMPDVPTGSFAVRSPDPVIEDGVAWWDWRIEPIPADKISLTRLQFALACLAAQIITEAEAEEFASGGALPQIALDALLQIEDDAARTVARIKFRAAEKISRSNPFIPLLQEKAGMTAAQVDDLFLLGLAF